MQKKLKSLNMAVAATALISLLSISTQADTQLPIQKELKKYNVSADLVMLAMLAQNNKWNISPSKKTNSIEISKTISYKRTLRGVHARWKKVSESVDVSALATLEGDKIVISSLTELENQRHIESLKSEIEKLQQVWEKNILLVSAQ